MMKFFGNTTKVVQRYRSRMVVIMLFYSLTVRNVTRLVRHHPPHGWLLYFEAALPTIPIICLLVVFGRYLREEVDEYKRLVLIRSILCGIAVTLAVSVFGDFVAEFGAKDNLPNFIEFVVFWITTAVVQLVQTILDKVSGNEESAA